MISHGAITVINAIPCGIGAAVGVDLVTRSEFTAGGTGRSVRIINDPGEDTNMARICVKNTFEHLDVDEPGGWSLSVDSGIPISRGLKSSSSACNSIISSVEKWISDRHGIGFGDRGEDIIEMIRLGVRCAKEAGVTVTGAFDDACACHLGGFVITDNERNELVLREDVGMYDVILLVPENRIRKPSIDRRIFLDLSERMKDIIRIAEKDWLSALTENGRLIAKVLGIDDRIADRALNLGALAAGVSGTGPAVSAVVKKGEGISFLKDLAHDGYEAIVTRTR